jgi:formylglycine-generating enzyme required for sulfatase activity/serine/threonine protein kinase
MTEPQDPTPSPADSEHASFAERLKRKYGTDVDPAVSLDAAVSLDRADADAPSGASSELMRRLSDHSLKQSRYKLQGEIARGGMGAILKIWDEDLRRSLAMKVILGKGDAPTEGGTPAVDTKQLGRFLEEAQVTGQLDHPGIAPVHELGLDADGRVYFTMKLVKGRDLKQIFDLVFEEKEGWNETRALSVILKVCEAMAYAHSKGVIHRDLKPANVMVGSFGEVYVMDWGLARVLGRKDTHDIRLRPESATPLSSVKTERRAEREEAPDSPLVTMDGDVMGTPAYMPPEQARGEIEKLSPRSDVYAIGAMLYHLLTRRVPYVPPGARVNNHMVLLWVLEGPPKPMHELRAEIPAELAAICEKAMSRDAAQRYPDTLALADDLRAYLEHRVVAAYETGAVAELKKWVQRNKPLATASAAAVLLLIGGLVASSLLYSQARESERVATQRANDVLSLSAIQDLKDLEARAEALWPATPENVPNYAAWLADARALIDGRPADEAHGIKARASLAGHEARLALIRQRAKPPTPEQREADRLTGRANELQHDIDERRTYDFDTSEDRWWHAQLSKLVSDLKSFQDAQSGGLFSSGTSAKYGWGIAKRAEFARTIEARSVSGADAHGRWDEAIAAIAKSPKYGGIALTPQLGLLPIGEDPESHLWEFAHLATGDPAERRANGQILLKEETGLVFVLVPGGKFWMGAQKSDPNGRNYDPEANEDESIVHEVTLSPYFLSKYEMTQAQWQRFAGRNPSTYGPGRYIERWNRSKQGWTALHPVEQVSWTDCMSLLSRLALTLPSEAQWERAARGGTDTPWWTGTSLASLVDAANLSDAYGKKHGNEAWSVWEEKLDDGQSVHAPVGLYRANPFGLHDVIGNLWEWCLDGHDGNYSNAASGVDPVAPWSNAETHVNRGGAFSDGASEARSARRFSSVPNSRNSALGLRPARAVLNPDSPPHSQTR